jgi:anion-transporting  ArsA/GET3 family ATPase
LQSSWDLIVLDTPPTSNALDFLTAPERLIDAIDSPAVRWFMQAIEPGQSTFGLGLVGRASTVLVKGLAKFTGIEFLEEVAGFVTGLNDLFGGFREHANAVSAALRSPEVAFVVVTSPSPMAIREATYFSDKLADAGMRRDAIVINGVHTLLSEPSISDAALAETVGPHLSGMDAADTVDRMMQALQDERLQAVADRIESDRLQNHIRRSRGGDGVLFVEVPAFEEDVHDLKALARVASYLTETVGAAV